MIRNLMFLHAILLQDLSKYETKSGNFSRAKIIAIFMECYYSTLGQEILQSIYEEFHVWVNKEWLNV